MFLSSLFGHMTTLSKQNKTTAPKYKKPKDAILLKMKANLEIGGSDLNNQHKSKRRIVFECPNNEIRKMECDKKLCHRSCSAIQLLFCCSSV